MASMNTVLSPPLHSDTMNSPAILSAKRKRDDSSEDQNHTHGITESRAAESIDSSHGDSQDLIRDLIDVLKTHDTTPSILTRSLPERPFSSGPQAKRQRSGEDAELQASIMTRFLGNAYQSLDEVIEDIDTAASDIADKLQPSNGTTHNKYYNVPSTSSETTLKVAAFKQRAHELVRKERAAALKNPIGAQVPSKYSGYSTNGLGSNPITEVNTNQTNSKMVLTLYGNAPVPKQLFSSLQIPTKAAGKEKDIVQSLRESGLPAGITTTQVVSLQATGLLDEKKRAPTLGELFPTPPNVPAFKVPTQSKIANTKSSTVGWYQPNNNEIMPRNASYFRQPISTGQWLDYSNAALVTQGTKKKQRDRALSLSAAKAPQIEAEPAESEAAKLDALFRGAYTSFAPTKDDAAAVAPSGVVERLWWQQFGEDIWGRYIENSELFDDATDPGTDRDIEEVTEEVDELQLFEDAITALERDSVDPSLVSLDAKVEKSAEEKDVDEILQGISELLETLNSYQRIRHLNLNSSSRPAGLLSAPDATSIGTPTKPSEPEQATYEILRSQLTLMIAGLPPYAVAKLNSDRLAELSISTKIEVQTNNYHGVMEEDEAAARAKVAALNAVSSTTPRPVPPATVHRSSSSSLYGNQYSASRSAAPPAQQYYSQSQTPIRPPSSLQRPLPAATNSYQQTQRPAAAPLYRPTYGTPTYPHQNPRPVQQQYQTPNQPQYHHAPTAQPYLRAPVQNYQQISQAAQAPAFNGRYANQPYAHQVQPPQNGIGYGYGNGVNVTRQDSPQKAMYSPQTTQAQPRPYSTPTPSIPQDRRQYFQNPISQSPMMNGTSSQALQSQYAPSQSSQPQYAHQQAGLTSYSTFMTQEQQSNLLERQRAQLAAQQSGIQHVARSTAQAAMGSSSPQINGGNALPAVL